MTDDHKTTWTSAPSHLDDCYWRRIYAGQMRAALIIADDEYRNRVEEQHGGLDVYSRRVADELVSEMNRTDRGAR